MGTLISWTTETWNPTTGCSKISAGCKNCYAEGLSLRFKRSLLPWTEKNAEQNIHLHPSRLDYPRKLKQPSRIFVNSMSDLFHRLIPDEFIARVFQVMNDNQQHVFQVLTKRPERAAEWVGPWTPNIWMGTSVEDNRVVHRSDTIKRCGAAVKFISAEPLIGPLDQLDTNGLDWVIVGGESGMNHRPMPHSWARQVRDKCVESGTAFFFKQSTNRFTERGIALVHEDGSHWLWQQMPDEPGKPPVLVPSDNPDGLNLRLCQCIKCRPFDELNA